MFSLLWPEGLLARVGLIAALAAAVWLHGCTYGASGERVKANEQKLFAVERARKIESAWAEQFAKSENLKNDEIDRINARLLAATRELRNRPERMPAASAPGCQGADGSQLSRADAEFLAGEAAIADRLQSALRKCYNDFDAISPAASSASQ